MDGVNASQPFRHPRTDRRLRQISYALKRGLPLGVLTPVVMYLIQSYRQQSWLPPRELALALVIFCSVGILFNFVRFKDRQRT